ncbi:hypothetical protein T439DRAFT_329776 [Meredithblackwellia eburnea MCA 4105]
MSLLPSLVLAQTALPATRNNNNDSLILANRADKQLILSAGGDKIHILDDEAKLLQTLPFELAFPVHSTLDNQQHHIQALAFDQVSGRFACSSNSRIGVWEPTGLSMWRVHSSFVVPHLVNMLDFAKGRIVAGGDQVSVWELDEAHALPVWRIVGTESSKEPFLAARLTPSGGMLASVALGSTSVKISSINPSQQPNALQLRSRAWHSVRIRSVGWRPTDDPADSGPILFTTTMDGVFRIWGCMIDEPDFFSLWATLDVHSSLPSHVPLTTCFRQTRDQWPAETEGGSPARKGSKDDFVTVFSDGTVWSTTVQNFDCRPPTCLTQSSHRLHDSAFSPSQLANLRHTLLVPSADDELFLVCRCSRGSLLLADLSAPNIDEPPFSSAPDFVEPPKDVAVNFTGKIRSLVQSEGGESLLARGDSSFIQNWELDDDDDLIVETYVADARFEDGAQLATWHDGKMLTVATSTGLRVYEFRNHGRLRLITSNEVVLPSLLSFFVARTSLDALSTTIVAVAATSEVFSWTYNSATHSLTLGSRQFLARDDGSVIGAVSVPPKRALGATDSQEELAPSSSMSILVVDSFGTLSFWHSTLPDSSYEWRKSTSVHTGKQKIEKVASSSEFLTAVVTTVDGQHELSIWDSKASEFTSGELFTQSIDEAPIVDMHWSHDGGTLAIATTQRVFLLCAQLLDDLSGEPGWQTYVSIKPTTLTSSPVSALCWLSTGLVVASGEVLNFYSSKMTDGSDCHAFAKERSAPLPYHHPQLLFQSLLHGHTDAVIKVLVGIAAQLTPDGDVTPIRTARSAAARIRLQDFIVKKHGSSPMVSNGNATKDIFSALTNAAVGESDNHKVSLTEDDYYRLLAALKKCSMRGLSPLEHAHLTVVVQTVFDIQRQQGSLDANGLRYLVSMRSFFTYAASSVEGKTLAIPRLKYRDAVWAFHSENQELLVDASAKACPNKITWANAKALSLFIWLKSPELLSSQMEIVGRSEYIKPDSDDKDPITASLFYLALRKKHMVITLWKQAGGHPDQRNMIKMLANDFEEPRWKSAALKNAFALISKRRFLFAAAFFVLGDSLKDAVNICLRQLDDFQLAIALARVYEGDNGPILRSILEETVLPLAFKQGFRWLGSWAFWMLGRRDLAIQTIVTPLSTLAARLPYRLDTIGRPMHEDPCLVLLFAQLRSWSLQTVKGATAVPGHTEFNFVLHMSRVLTRMGCHVLALNLVQSWEFAIPEVVVPQRRASIVANRRPGRLSLRRASTKIDIDIPSNLGSRAPSPERAKVGGAEFHHVLKETKKVTAAPPEFDMGAFGF